MSAKPQRKPRGKTNNFASESPPVLRVLFRFSAVKKAVELIVTLRTYGQLPPKF
jgi:hypothetical protein